MMKVNLQVKAAVLSMALPLMAWSQTSLLEDQLRYQRVRASFEEHRDLLDSLEEIGMDRIFIRVFKLDRELELWIAHDPDEFKLLRSYYLCGTSGIPGPKRREGDLQIPEGVYHVDRFNPFSNFYLSLGINYPNRSDRKLSDPISPGSNIFIHGSCATIGCMPINDEGIRELYIVALYARSSGQASIPVHILPVRMENGWANEPEITSGWEHHAEFWTDLKLVYDYFEKYHQLPDIRITEDGRYEISKAK